MLNNLDYTYYLQEGGHWVQVGVFTLFIIGCIGLWAQTYQASVGHDLIGRATIVVLLIALYLMAWGPDRLTLMRILIYGSLSIWIFYNGWYFYRYSIPVEFLKATGRPPVDPSLPIFVPRQAFLRYLIRTDTDTQKRVRIRLVRNLVLGCGLIFLIAWGFSRTINAFGWGQRMVVEERKKAQQELKAAVSKAVAAATSAMQKEVAPLKEGQRASVELAKTALEKADKTNAQVKGEFTRLNQKTDRATRTAAKADAKAGRALQSPVIPVDKIQPKPTTGVIDPGKVKPPLRRGKYGCEGCGEYGDQIAVEF